MGLILELIIGISIIFINGGIVIVGNTNILLSLFFGIPFLRKTKKYGFIQQNAPNLYISTIFLWTAILIIVELIFFKIYYIEYAFIGLCLGFFESLGCLRNRYNIDNIKEFFILYKNYIIYDNFDEEQIFEMVEHKNRVGMFLSILLILFNDYVSFIICLIGIITFYNESYLFTYIGAWYTIVQSFMLWIRGDLKSLSTLFFSAFLGILLVNDFWLGIAIGVCYESVITAIFFIIVFIVNGIFLSRTEKQFEEEQNKIQEESHNIKIPNTQQQNNIPQNTVINNQQPNETIQKPNIEVTEVPINKENPPK